MSAEQFEKVLKKKKAQAEEAANRIEKNNKDFDEKISSILTLL